MHEVVTFDIQSPAPPADFLIAETKKVETRLTLIKAKQRAVALAGGICFLLFSYDLYVDFGADFDVLVAWSGVLIAIGFYHYLVSRHNETSIILSDLKTIESNASVQIFGWCATDPALAAYQHQVEAQGQSLVAAEAQAMGALFKTKDARAAQTD